jgi:hypothetical protein
VPSSALPPLQLAARGAEPTFSLTRLGWLYGLLAAGATALAAWAATARGVVRALVLVAAVAPLANDDFSRFFVSTFAEPAGLLGALALVSGVAVVNVTQAEDRVERLVALVLTGGGGLVAGTAKNAYAPLLLLAAGVAVVTAVAWRQDAPRWTRRIVGPLAGAAVLGAAVGPMAAAQEAQARIYAGVNSHNLVFTLLLPEVGPEATAAVGLPIEAAQASGRGYFGEDGFGIDPATTIPGWQAAVGERPDEVRNAAFKELARHPEALLRAVGIGMQATLGRDIAYLPSDPLPPGVHATTTVVSVGGNSANSTTLRQWLDGMAHPWWPSALSVLGLLAGAAGLRWRGFASSAFARTAGVAAGGAVGLAVLAVLGDGYNEVAKHVWLAAYLLDVTLVSLVVGLVLSAVRAALAAGPRALRLGAVRAPGQPAVPSDSVR